ncbi:MAG: hypothetical protein HKN76_11985 [Saprospiraceae bacterium]|nr:hypothetical protein [Saprospiraceae bacterium]
MKQSDKEEKIVHAGLIEEYVLGICEPRERERVERLADEDPKIAALITDMQKAMHCYCSSCHSDKIKSIQTKYSANCSSSPKPSSATKLFKLPCAEKAPFLHSYLLRVKVFFDRLWNKYSS